VKARIGPYTVSPLGVGLWQAASRSWSTRKRPAPVHEIVKAALENEINLFDTAEVYGWGESERLLGEALRTLQAHDQAIIATKVAGFRATRGQILRAAENSKRRLGRAPDLLQYHWPPPPCSTICRVARAMEEAVLKGHAGAWGVSNFDGAKLQKAAECARRLEPVSDQVQYSLAYRAPENDVIPTARSLNATIIAWSPLAKGSLAGLQHPKTPAQSRDPVFRAAARDTLLQETLQAVAEKHGATKAQVALAWLITKGAIPIPGSRKPARIAEYAKAAKIKLGEYDIHALDKASQKYLHKWGRKYKALQWLRYIPAPLQYIVIGSFRGV